MNDDQNQPADAPADNPQDQPLDQPVAESTASEETKPKLDQIEVQQYDAPIKKPLSDFEEDNEDEWFPRTKPTSYKPMGMPPVKAPGTNQAVVVTTMLAIAVLTLGFGGGYFGYKNWPALENRGAVSADITSPDATTPKAINTPNTTTPSSTDKLSNWTTYANTKYQYSIKYPETWFSQGTNSPTSSTVQLTSFNPTQSGSEIQSGSKVEIVFQDTNGKTLKDWIEANNAAMTLGTPTLSSLKVGEKDAYQENLTSPLKSIVTYLVQADKIMMISYYAAAKDFETGTKIYQDILTSIKFN